MFKTLVKLLSASALALSAAIAFAAGVDANKATQAELEVLKGIGPTVSGRLLEARKAGPFKDWADMMSRVKGMGPGAATKLSAQGLVVNDKAYPGAAVAEAGKADKPTKPATKQ